VSKVERVHDYLQITFSDESTVNVYNKYSYDGDVSDLEGKTLLSIAEQPDLVSLRFFGSELQISLADDDFSGPEAIEFRRPGKKPVVWN
jgi:hypothetical protein